MSRQVGKDFSCAFEGIRQCARAEYNGESAVWLIAAPSERQSLESLQKWRNFAEVFELALEDVQEKREPGPESLLSSATLRFPHGCQRWVEN
jgi:phage FluMu gp28-like protein